VATKAGVSHCQNITLRPKDTNWRNITPLQLPYALASVAMSLLCALQTLNMANWNLPKAYELIAYSTQWGEGRPFHIPHWKQLVSDQSYIPELSYNGDK